MSHGALDQDEFLEICQRSGIRVGFVFFDDCWSHEGLDLQKPCQPTKAPAGPNEGKDSPLPLLPPGAV